MSKARGKGLWKPTVNSKLCSIHFEPNCFRHFNGRVYLNTGAVPTVVEIPEHLQKGTRCARESDASSSRVVSPSPEREEVVFVPAVVEGRAFDYEGNLLNSEPVKVAKFHLSRLDEEQLRQVVASPAQLTTVGQRMSVEAKEADGKRPIIVRITSSDPESRPSRMKRLPEKLRSGDFDNNLGEEPPMKAARLESNLDESAETERISDDGDLGDESDDALGLDEEEYEECSDGESAEPPTAYRSQAIKTTALDESATPAAAPKSAPGGPSAGTVVELCTQLDEQRVKNEELTKQLAKAKVEIENQNRNIEALQDVINNLRQRIVAMSKKCSATAEPMEVNGEAKE